MVSNRNSASSDPLPDVDTENSESADEILEQHTESDEGERKWKESEQGWDEVLIEDGETSTETDGKGESTERRIDGESKLPEELQVIDPMPESVVEHLDAVLPERWVSDAKTQQYVQWVSYAFLTMTDPSERSRTRLRRSMDIVANELDVTRIEVKRTCTTSLYPDDAKPRFDSFQTDLIEVEDRLSETGIKRTVGR